MNRTAQYDFTIIVPVYNEIDNMPVLERTLRDYLGRSSVKSCVLFVDDGSADGSGEELERVCSRNEDMFFIRFARNCGLSAAIKAGFDVCYSKYVGYIDADLQTAPEDFELLLPHAGEFPLVMGIRTGRKDSFVKKCSSKFANGFRRMMTDDGVADTGCPLKVLQTEYARKMPFFTGMHRFMPALIQLERKDGVKQIPVRHFPRTAGTSKYHLWNRLFGPLKDCFAYRWMRKRYISYQIGSSDL